MTISETIRHEIDRWMHDFKYDIRSPKQINQGFCGKFAKDVRSLTDEEAYLAGDSRVMCGQVCNRWLFRVGHVWVTDGILHYDSERPDGADDWKDLPFYNRHSQNTPSL